MLEPVMSLLYLEMRYAHTFKTQCAGRLGKSARDSPAPEDRSTPTIGDGAAGSDKAGLRGVAEVRTMNMTRQTLVGLR